MKFPVLIEELPEGRGFRVHCGGPFNQSAEGETRLEAITRLEEAINRRMLDGAELMTIDI